MIKFAFTVTVLILIKIFTNLLEKPSKMIVLYLIIVLIYLFDTFDFLVNRYVDLFLYGLVFLGMFLFSKKAVTK